MSDGGSLISDDDWEAQSNISDDEQQSQSQSPERELGFKEQEGRSKDIVMTDNESILSDKIIAIVQGNSQLEKMIDIMKLKIKELEKPQYVYPVGFLLGFMMSSGYSYDDVIYARNKIVEHSLDVEISDPDIIKYYRLVSKKK
jgi:hypothetical protein